MKKENKKIAQERRAAQRKKQEEKQKQQKTLLILIPAILILVLVMLLILDSLSSTDPTSKTAYSTDASLTVQDGDSVNIDYVGSIDGVEFDGGSTQGAGATLVIGSGSYIDDFEEQLIGAHPGDEVDVVVTFPEDYGNAALNGKEALFKVTVNGIYQ